jgi:hypothetical protein
MELLLPPRMGLKPRRREIKADPLELTPTWSRQYVDLSELWRKLGKISTGTGGSQEKSRRAWNVGRQPPRERRKNRLGTELRRQRKNSVANKLVPRKSFGDRAKSTRRRGEVNTENHLGHQPRGPRPWALVRDLSG